MLSVREIGKSMQWKTWERSRHIAETYVKGEVGQWAEPEYRPRDRTERRTRDQIRDSSEPFQAGDAGNGSGR